MADMDASEPVAQPDEEMSGDEGSDDNQDMAEPEVSSPEAKAAIERQEEEKFRAKFGNMPPPMRGGGAGGRGGHSAFLQKRLAKGQKYFDSGDYQMAKQKSRGGLPSAAGRTQIIVPILDSPSTGDAIPTPDSVPVRKTSIIQPINDASRSMHMPSDPAHLAGGGSPVSPGHGHPLPNPALAKLTL